MAHYSSRHSSSSGGGPVLALVTGVFVLCIALTVHSCSSGTRVFNSSVDMDEALSDGDRLGPITLTQKGRPVRIHIDTTVDNSWVWLKMVLMNEDGQPLTGFSDEIGYYHGYSGGESWSEGSRDANHTFKLQEPGTYYLGVGAEWAPGRKPDVHVFVYEGALLARYYVIMAIISGIALFFLAAKAGFIEVN